MPIFNNFPDTVEWKHQTGKDAFGQPKYSSEDIKARRNKTVKDFVLESGAMATKYVNVYHVPMEHDIKTNDLIDGYRVDSVSNIRGADNVYVYKRVICE